MRKTIFIFGIGATLFFIAQSVFADITINEIMYDVEGTDTDREWIEVYNSGSDAVGLSTWKFVEANSNHGIVPFEGGSSIPAGGYAVIANKPEKFKLDWSNFSGILFDSSFSLNNDPGEELSLKDDTLTVVDTITYVTSVGAAGDGNTLNRAGSAFVSGAATPGAINEGNQSQDLPTDDDTDQDINPPPPVSIGNSTPVSRSVPVKKDPTPPAIVAEIINKPSVIAQMPAVFDLKVLGFSGEPLEQGRFYINFGDGNSTEIYRREKVFHTYDISGEYIVSFEYSRNQYVLDTEPDATDRAVIKVVDPEVIISSLGADGSVEISNTGKNEADISGWVLRVGDSSFTFPKKSIILGNKKFVLSQKVTKFIPGFIEAKLFLPTGIIASTYGSNSEEPTIYSFEIESVNVSGEFIPEMSSESEFLSQDENISEEYVPLTANAIDAVPEGGNNNIIFSIAGLVALLCIAGASVYYLYPKRRPKSPADDFELVE